jgi:hypothetical protein
VSMRSFIRTSSVSFMLMNGGKQQVDAGIR